MPSSTRGWHSLDIEGAFDNVSFDAIERALDSKCESAGVNRWIMSMIRSRRITVELHGEKKVIVIRKGCPQGGILSPFLWNLVSTDRRKESQLEEVCACSSQISLFFTS